MAVALIVAAGRGERLGSSRPKALVTLAGRPMLEWSVEALRPVVEAIVIAMPEAQLDAAPAGTSVVAGGAMRSQSVRAALEASGEGDPVVVHDAARPLASSSAFARVLEELERSGADAVIAGAPAPDTVKEVDDERRVLRTLERSRLWAVQTPQAFRREALARALARDELLARATDDAWLIEQQGGDVRVLDCGEPNFKITTPGDLRIAELILSSR